MAGHLVIVPTAALNDPRLSHAEFKTLCHISTFASTENGWCWFLMSTLAEQMNVSTRAAQKHIKKLVEYGYIIRKAQFKNGQQRCNRYQVILNTSINKGGEREVQGGGEREVQGGGEREVHTERSLINDRERDAQRREWFLREIDKGFKEGRFGDDDLGHLTESEIISAAKDCYGTWGDDLRGRDCPTVLRTWLKQGMRSGAVRKASKPSLKQEVTFTEPDNAIQEWHIFAQQIFDPAIYQTYFRPAEHDGNGTLYVAKSFHVDYIESRFSSELKTLFPNGVELVTKAKEKELVT